MITRCNAKRAGHYSYGVYTVNKTLAKDLLSFCAKHILNNNGVVRKFENLGSKSLPYRMKRHQEIFDCGSYFTMTFDSNPQVMDDLCKQLKLNESVIRHSIVKKGDRLTDVSGYIAPERMV
jgi:small subunit ribosomal protein S6